MLNANRAAPQQVHQPSSWDVQINQYAPNDTAVHYSQYRAFLVSTRTELDDFAYLVVYYGNTFSKPANQAIHDMFYFKGADWLCRVQAQVDQTQVERINQDAATYNKIKDACNASTNAPAATPVQPTAQVLSPLQPQRPMQMAAPAATNSGSMLSKLGGGTAPAAIPLAAPVAAIPLAGVPQAHGAIPLAQPVVAPVVAPVVTPVTPMAPVTQRQPVAAPVVTPEIVEPVVKEKQYTTLDGYLSGNTITDYHELIEAHMNKESHQQVNKLVSKELKVTSKVVARRMEHVKAKTDNNQTDVEPADSAKYISEVKDPGFGYDDPRKLFSYIYAKRMAMNEQNAAGNVVFQGLSLTDISADDAPNINTQLVSRMSDGELTALADRMLKIRSSHINTRSGNYGDMNVVMAINKQLTDHVNRYIGHRWGGAFTIDSFMDDYADADYELANQYDVPRGTIVSMGASFGQSIAECTMVEVDDVASWCTYHTGIILQRTVQELGWEVMTRTPLGVNDIGYNNIIAMIRQADASNMFVNVYVEDSCFRVLVTEENRMTVELVY